MKVKNIKPVGDMLLLELKEIKQKDTLTTKSGIITLNKKDPTTTKIEYKFVLKEIGSGVPEGCSYKVGDTLLINQYDLLKFDLENPDDETKLIPMGLIKSQSVMAVLEIEEGA